MQTRAIHKVLFAAVLISISALSSVGHAFPAPTVTFDSLLEQLRKKHDLPALAAAIISSDKIYALEAVGSRRFDKEIPVTKDDQFHIGSCTKSMTATLIGMLVEAKKLKWNTTLLSLFPEWKDSMNKAYRNVTIDQLLAHRSGFTDNSWLKGVEPTALFSLPGTPREQRTYYVEKMLTEAPAYKAGSKYLYSNRNYIMLGAIIEKILDKDWESVIQEKLFQPLGMTTAGFGAMGTPGKEDEPWQHTFDQGGARVPVEPGPMSDNPYAFAPAGRVHCSILDWAKYVQMHLQGDRGKNTLLKASTMKKLHTPIAGEYAGGWNVVKREWAGGDGRALTHSGSNMLSFVTVWIAPNADFAILAMTNQGGGNTADAMDDIIVQLLQYHYHSVTGK